MISGRWIYLISAILISFFIGCSPASNKSVSAEPETKDLKYIAQGEPTGKYWPTNGWKTSKPEAVGMDSQKLAEAIDYAATPKFNTDGILVIKNGYIVSEAYFRGFRKDVKHVSHSMAKSFTSALIGIAIDKGLVSGVDEKLCKHFHDWDYEEWDCDDEDDYRSRITIRHAMTLTTGLEWSENWATWDPKTNDTLKMFGTGRWLEYMTERFGQYEPGTRFYYSTGDSMLLTGVIKKATGMSAFEFAKQNLFAPLNITNVRWDSDQDGYTATTSQLFLTIRDYAKFGFLYLNKGKWEDQQVVPEHWVDTSTKTDRSVRMWDAYGYLWHVDLPKRLNAWGSKIPSDGYMAEGVLGQNIFIIPSHNLVIVKVANQTRSRMSLVRFLTMILDADKAK